MYDTGLDAPLSEPARQPKSVTPRFIGDDDAFDLTSGLNGLMTPSVHEFQQLVLVGFQLLQRLALDARDHSCDSQLDWLISITTMSVLSWFRAVKDRLRSFDCSMGRSKGLLDSAESAMPSPLAPYHLRVRTQAATNLTPTITDRRVKSSIMAPAGQTVLLAGLIQETQ